ncbi:MAG: hypothetical protein RLZZ350_701 [Verrucomicrobiota bacterium]
MSGGSYAQNFDTLGSASVNWTNNVTLPNWYATKGTLDATNLIASTGTSATGGIYSFGAASTAERALGSLAAAAITYYYGVRFTNNGANPVTNVSVSYTGEEWRVGATNAAQQLTFAYQISNNPLTNALAGNWINFSALNFVSPNLTVTNTGALDGNQATNRTVFTNLTLTGVTVQPGQEMFLRWSDTDDAGSDNGLAIDDLTVVFSSGSVAPTAPTITTPPVSQTATVGSDVTFTVVASGTAPLSYQWQFNSTNLAGATNDTLTLTGVTTNQTGNYSVTVTNAGGSTNSQNATLTVSSAGINGFSIVTYNTHGNGITNWSTNTAQVQAIGRQMMYLNPDIITFLEIPNTLVYEMTNFVKAFLPGYFLATNSGTDGFIRSVIASRFVITRSTKWLDGADLNPFGYTNANFTRDLFEAQITVPTFSQPLHIFTTHLKSSSGGYTDAANRRAAEAAAITNFFATNFFVLYPLHPYLLTGDFNESDTNTLAIQRLVNSSLGLPLINPTNPFTGKINTYSIQTSSTNPTERIDYILPGGVLISNVSSSQVFRSDKLPTAPPPLLTFDDVTASDHLPVMATFANPYLKPIRLVDFARSNTTTTMEWTTVFGGVYQLQTSTNLTTWITYATNLTATGSTLRTNSTWPDTQRFFRVLLK